jgi:arylsulfatase A-like enzyme
MPTTLRTATHWLLALAVAALPVASVASEQGGAGPRQPNVVIVITDDQGYADVGFNGSTEIPTPNIDRIAKEGVRFTRAYVTFPVCGPSRAGLLTGRHQSRFGYDRNPNGDPTDPRGGIPRTEEILPEMLKRAGYYSMAVGKWHMGTHPTLRPRARGFDEFYGFIEGGHSYRPEEIEFEDISESKKPYDWYRTKLVDNGKRVLFDQYLTDELSDRAVDFVRRRAGQQQPFFLYLAYNAPHAPLQATEKYLARFSHIADERRRTYAAMISAVDDGVGRVLAELDARGVADNTIFIFLSDNGGVIDRATGEQPVADNGPLRGGKSQLFEGGIRVPFAIRWPPILEGGRDFTRPISAMDITGTLASQTGVAIRTDKPLDGVDLIPYLKGEKSGDPQPVLFFRKFDQKQAAMVIGDLKYVDTGENRLLFNLRSDESEKNNIAPANAENMAQFARLYDVWHAQMARQPAFPPLGTWPKQGGEKKAPARKPAPKETSQ